jgi:hypothetical protein
VARGWALALSIDAALYRKATSANLVNQRNFACWPATSRLKIVSPFLTKCRFS